MGNRTNHPVSVFFAAIASVALSLVLSGCGLGGATTTSTTTDPGTVTDVTLIPTTVDFGTVPIKSTSKVPFTLTNSGNQTLNVLQVDITGSAFTVTNLPLPLAIAPGSTYTANATFSPTVAGTNTGTVTVTTDKTKTNNGKKVGLTGNGGTSTLAANPTTVSFGSVAVGKTASQSVTVTNSGTVALKISAASVSSASFAVTDSTWVFPVSLAAGSSKPLNVSYAPKTSGTSTGTVTFTSDATSGASTVSLSGTATTAGQLSASPASVVFGNVSVGASPTQTLTLTNTGGNSLSITAMSSNNAAVTLSGLTLPVTIASGASVNATVKFTPTTATAVSASLSFTNDGATSPFTVAVSGTGVQPILAITPTSISFGSVNTTASSTQSLTLQNSGTANLTVSGVAASGAGFSVTGFAVPLTLTPGQSVVGSAVFTPTVAGSASGSITVTSNSAVAVSPVSLSGSGVAGAPVAVLTPTSIAFGNVNVGASSPQSLNIKNTGNADLVISQVAATGAGFSVAGFTVPLTVPAGQSANGTVTFAPTTSGARTGSVTFTSNGNTVSATLSGTGVQPILTVSPTTIAFGNVNTGSSSTQPLSLQNTGTASLTVSAITPTGTGYTLTGFTLPTTIAAGQSVSGSVVFAPTTAGTFNGSVAFTSNSGTATSPLTLSGTGVQPQLAMTPTSMAFANVTTGTTSTQALTLRNSGTASLTVSQLTANGAGFTVTGFTLPLTLSPSATAAGSVVFAPTTAGAVTGSVTATSNSGTAVAPVALSGTGVLATPQISVTPTSIAFGSITTGTTTSAPLTLKNTGTADLNVTALTPTGAGYSVNGFILPLTLAPNASAVGNVVFAPTTTGTLNGSVTITSNSSTAAPTVTLTGSGTAPTTYLLSVSPTSLAFGTVVNGTSSTQTVRLTNNGTGSVSVSAGNVTGTGYTIGGVTFPLSIAAGAGKTVNVIFTPQISGAANGSVSFVSNASNSPATVTMTGSGQAPLPHSVDISWTASTSTGVNGYNVYRGTVSAGPYSLISSGLQAGTTFTDSTVSSGATYFYVVRAVDASGAESADSNVASAVIPSP